jgi:citrate lyase subunit beta-like protein
MDLAALKPVLDKVDSILIPKVEKAADCEYVTSFLESQGNKSTRIFACVETARGILSLEDICSKSNRLDAIIFGSEDYSADVGITRTSGLEELLFARSAVITSCAAYGIQAIDLVCIDYKNTEQLIKECQSGYNLGFDGKQAIHPGQIQLIYEHFRPPQQTLNFAKKIVDEYSNHLDKGVGTFVIDDKVIDMPMIKWAEKVLRKASLL